MIQLNLLPDVKLQYIKANRLKRMVSVVASFVALIAIAVLVIMIISVEVIQKAHSDNLNTQISTLSKQLKAIPNLNEALTVQEEANALPSLHAQKPVVTRLSNYLSELTPSSATISDFNADFSSDSLSITGAADSLATVNQFVDTLKLSSYQTASNIAPKNAFSNVILSAFGYATGSGASYTITADFDPTIFSGTYSNVTLNVPSFNTSRSTTSGSTALFQSQSTTSSSNSGSGQ